MIGKFYRLLPYNKAKNFIARKVIAPFVRGKGHEIIIKMKNPGGGRLICNLDDWIPWNVYIHGRYQVEGNYEDFMLNIASKSAVVFDIGANIGYYTIQFSRIFKKTGIIYSFEPLSYQYNLLKRNIALNNISNVIPIKMIVSDTDGSTRRVYFSGMENTGNSSLEIESQEYEDVATTTIDHFCEDKNIENIDLVKIDVEGHELSVLKGMEGILRKNIVKNLFVEINDETLSAAGTSTIEVVSFLGEFGYKPFSIAFGKTQEYLVGNSESLVYFRKDT